MNLTLPFSKDARIAVTGGTGFVGSYLLRTLIRQGCTNIKAIKRESSSFDLLDGDEHKIQWVKGDLLDTEIVWDFTKDVDILFHCAAAVSFNPSKKKQLYRVNVGGTAELCNAAIENGVKKLVHCSSISALGKELKGKPITEETEWKEFPGISDYALSKHQSELEVWRSSAEGLDVTILNPSLVMGAGFWNSGTAALFTQVNRELPFYPSGLIGFVDVRDVAEMLIHCADHQFNGRRFISSTANLSYFEVLKRIGFYLDKPAPKRRINKLMIATLPPILKFLRSFGAKVPPLSKPMLIASAQETLYDASAFIKETGFSYRPIEETIRETALQFRKSKELNTKFGILPIN
ncbi:MAG: NAD-dependent epimerase/dehydratase family protein [Saprospirales bacterium]|nr:MAG: NAD-dependent epimerase/dehydratase family protein [Saprospirales bacterium]